MSNKCPKCGSVRIMKASEGVSICLNCESILNTIDGKSKPTVFDRITASPEALADRFIYFSYRRWRSSLLPGMKFWEYPEARAATVEKLEEVCSD